MSLNDLPTWLLWQIAQESSDVYKGLVFASRKLGLWSLKNQKTIRDLFIVKIDVPAVQYRPAHTKYVLCGKVHRDDGPAIEHYGGVKEWWVNGKRHRVGAPAIEYGGVIEEWWENGKRHRVGAPAVVFGSVIREWWENGFKIG